MNRDNSSANPNAQPLCLPGVVIPGQGIHKVVFVATEHDSVYALDADKQLPSPLWRVSFVNRAQGVLTASANNLGCGSIAPQVGITGTPVIDQVSVPSLKCIEKVGMWGGSPGPRTTPPSSSALSILARAGPEVRRGRGRPPYSEICS
jgi:hypothetical protein